MGRRVFSGLLAAAIVFGAGYWAYRKYSAAQPVPVLTPGVVESPRTVPPNTGMAGKAPASNAAVEKGEASVAPPEFAPRAGETLEFAANVTKAFAHTENPYRMVFELDDQFDSYSEASNMSSLQYEMHLSERGQKVDTVERMLSSSKDPAPPDAVAARVLPGTRDPLGMLMYLRSVDWNKVTLVRSPVFDGHKLYDVRAVLVARDQGVSVTAGKFNTTKIEIHVMDNGAEMKDAHFLLYIAQSPERLPVLMEAVLPVATARVELTKVH